MRKSKMGIFFGSMALGFFTYFVARITQELHNVWQQAQASQWGYQ